MPAAPAPATASYLLFICGTGSCGGTITMERISEFAGALPLLSWRLWSWAAA